MKRGVYKNVINEISREFNGRTIEEIRNNRDMILLTDDDIVIKLRLPDKKQRLSKKDGYRLVYLVSRINETVVFLDIYPKNGPYQQLDISDKDLAILLEQIADEEQTHTLIDYGIDCFQITFVKIYLCLNGLNNPYVRLTIDVKSQMHHILLSNQ